MNDELTTQSTSTSLVLKLKKYDDHHSSMILPHTSHLSTETIDDEISISSLFNCNNESTNVITSSPSTLRVKLKKSFLNGNVDHNDEDYINSTSSENLIRPAKRYKTFSSNDNISNNISNNDQMSSQQGTQNIDLKQDYSMINDQSSSSSLILKIRRDSLTTTTTTNSTIESMSTEYLINEQQNCSTTNEISSTIHTNNHNDLLYKSLTVQPATSSNIPTTSSSDQTNETHTKELLDEALDSVKNVLMQTFKKNLESGGDLNALKTTLGSDEVAEVFLAKLRQSLKRDTDNEIKSSEIHTDTDTPTTSSNIMMSPVTNVVSSPLLPSISSIFNKNHSSSSSSVNNKRKISTPSTNPNRFDGTTEEELTKRILSDILQPNLDIVFVGINPSLYAVHKGHHYGGPGNHFWKLLHMSSLIPDLFNANDDYRMPQYGIGFTNIVQRPSKAGSDITKDEIVAGAEILMQKIKLYRPKIVAFNGRGIYEVYAGNKHFHYGKQPDLFLGTDTHVFVMPSSSARCSQLPRAEDKLPFYISLRKLRDFVNGKLHSLNEAEITFPDIKIKDTDDVLQKTVIRISNKSFSELSAETLKTYGDKIPSGQMISKYILSPSTSPTPSSSSTTTTTNLVFNTDALTTQTMSILHNTNNQQNGNLLNYNQPKQHIYSQNNGNSILSSSKNSFIDNTSSNTNAAVLAALANGECNSSLQTQTQQTYYQPIQTIFIGGQQQQQSVSYSTPLSQNNNSTYLNSRSSLPFDHQNSTSSSSQIVSHQLVVVNSSESLPSFDTILNSSSIRTQQISSKDSISSHQSTSKQKLIILPPPPPQPLPSQTIKPISSSSTLILPKSSNTNSSEKRSRNHNDECLYVRYERELNSINSDQYRFSYIIDEHSSSLHKRLRYVSINDL